MADTHTWWQRGHLPDLSALVSWTQRRRRRRPARHRRAARLPRVARRGRHLAVADLSVADGRLRLRRLRLQRRRPAVRHARRLRRADRRSAPPRHQSHARLRAEPHLRPSIRGSSSRAPSRDERQARLVHLARPGAGRRAAQQLAERLRRRALGVGRDDAASTTSTPSYASSPSSTGAIRRCARRCTTSCASGSSAASTASASTSSGSSSRTISCATTRRTPTSCRTCGPYHALLPVYTADRPEVSRDHRRDARRGRRLSATGVLIGEIYLRSSGWSPTTARTATGVHLPFNFQLISSALARARASARSIEAYEAALPAGGWPNWVLGNHDQPRDREPRRLGAGARRGHAAADAARHADALLRRRDRHARRRRSRRSWSRTRGRRTCPGSAWPRPRAHADAVGRDADAGFTTGRPWLPLARDAPRQRSPRARDRRRCSRSTAG